MFGRRLRWTGAVLLGWVVMSLAPSLALATSPVITDCVTNVNSLSGHYSARQLQQALKELPVTESEYGNCQQVISDQLNRQLGKRRGGGSDDSGNIQSSGSSSTLVIAVIVIVVLILAGGGILFSRLRGGGGDSDQTPG